MASGKAISLFLIDGTPDGIIACEILNWTGKGYRIPKNKLKNASDRSELKKAGIYFLIGESGRALFGAGMFFETQVKDVDPSAFILPMVQVDFRF